MLLLNTHIVPENKTWFYFIYILCVFVRYIFAQFFLEQRLNNDYFYFHPRWPKYPPYFLILCYLEKLIWKLVWL